MNQLDQFIGLVALLAGEADEFFRFGDDCPAFGAADHCDAAAPSELQQFLIAE